MSEKQEARAADGGEGEAARLADLLERVEAATGPDRELDGDLYWNLQRRRAEIAYWNASLGMPRQLPDDFKPPLGFGRQGVISAAPHFTASLDAALALVERVRPGMEIRLRTYVDAKACVELGRRMGTIHEMATEVTRGSTPPLALLAALLKSLLADTPPKPGSPPPGGE